MTIYIDLLFFLNIFYDFILLLTVSMTLKRNVSLKKIIIGSLFGGVITFLVLIPFNKFVLLFLKIISGIIMCMITFGYKSFKYTINNLTYLYMCSVIEAGFLYFLKLEFKNKAYIITLLSFPIILYIYVLEQRKLKKIINYYKDVLITLKNNKKIKLRGFLDSGNRLKDPITNKYIILINKDRIDKIYNIRSPIYVPINTVNGSSLLECIGIKNIQIEDKLYNNYLLGLSNDFQGFDEVDCLLNYNLMEDNNV